MSAWLGVDSAMASRRASSRMRWGWRMGRVSRLVPSGVGKLREDLGGC